MKIQFIAILRFAPFYLALLTSCNSKNPSSIPKKERTIISNKYDNSSLSDISAEDVEKFELITESITENLSIDHDQESQKEIDNLPTWPEKYLAEKLIDKSNTRNESVALVKLDKKADPATNKVKESNQIEDKYQKEIQSKKNIQVNKIAENTKQATLTAHPSFKSLMVWKSIDNSIHRSKVHSDCEEKIKRSYLLINEKHKNDLQCQLLSKIVYKKEDVLVSTCTKAVILKNRINNITFHPHFEKQTKLLRYEAAKSIIPPDNNTKKKIITLADQIVKEMKGIKKNIKRDISVISNIHIRNKNILKKSRMAFFRKGCGS